MNQITENSYTKLGAIQCEAMDERSVQSCKGGPRDKGEWLDWTELCCMPLSFEQTPVHEEAAIISGKNRFCQP